jgi:hypothetical protein
MGSADNRIFDLVVGGASGHSQLSCRTNLMKNKGNQIGKTRWLESRSNHAEFLRHIYGTPDGLPRIEVMAND